MSFWGAFRSRPDGPQARSHRFLFILLWFWTFFTQFGHCDTCHPSTLLPLAWRDAYLNFQKDASLSQLPS